MSTRECFLTTKLSGPKSLTDYDDSAKARGKGPPKKRRTKEGKISPLGLIYYDKSMQLHANLPWPW